MKKLVSLLTLFGALFSAQAATSDSTFSLICSRIQAENESSYPSGQLDKSVRAALAALDSTGAFADIDYNNAEGRTSGWAALTHIDRAKDMATAYTAPESRYCGSDTLYRALLRALRYWAEHHPKPCNNWWWNDLPQPQRLGIALVQLRKGKRPLPDALEAKLVADVMRPGWHRGSGYFTGANRVDYATHWVYSACLLRDTALLARAVGEVFQPLQLTVREGLQHDLSYHQHGPQLYIGGYGDELVKGVTLVASLVAGTGYALAGEQQRLLSDFVRRTWLPSMRGQYLQWNVTGRGFTRRGEINKSRRAAPWVARMARIDTAHADEYRIALRRLQGEADAAAGVAPHSMYYYRSDFALHVRPAFTANVRTASTRTSTVESGNGENLKGFYLADGSMSLNRHGGEYADLFPAWNWTRIPGVTAPQKPFTRDPAYRGDRADGSANPYLPKNANFGTRGTSTFAGGATDSLYTVAAYRYTAGSNGARGNKTGVGGCKSWFFFDDEIVCLGAGIYADTSVADYDVLTTVNQCNLRGQVLQSRSGTPQWVVHDGMAYLFPRGGNVGLSTATQRGTWYDINHSESRDTVARPTFTLYLNHGRMPRNAGYAYIIAPALRTEREVKDYQKADNVQIVAHSDTLQAVYHRGLAMLQAVFFEAGAVDFGRGMRVSASRPCALIVRHAEGGRVALHVANVAQAAAPITITVSSGTRTLAAHTFSFPEGIYAGATLHF